LTRLFSVASGVVGSCYVYLDDFSASALAFYDVLEAALAKRQIPDARISRVHLREGGFLSAKREYLRVERQGTAFDIGAAPFGRGYFFSWWLVERPSRLPRPLRRLLGTETRHAKDTAELFRVTVSCAILEVVDEFTFGQGTRISQPRPPVRAIRV